MRSIAARARRAKKIVGDSKSSKTRHFAAARAPFKPISVLKEPIRNRLAKSSCRTEVG